MRTGKGKSCVLVQQIVFSCTLGYYNNCTRINECCIYSKSEININEKGYGVGTYTNITFSFSFYRMYAADAFIQQNQPLNGYFLFTRRSLYVSIYLCFFLFVHYKIELIHVFLEFHSCLF